MDTSTVYRIIQRFDSSGDASKKAHPQGHNHHLKRLTEIDEFLILELVVEKPGISLKEIQAELSQTTGTEISVSSICCFLHKNRFTRRKLTRVAGQRSDFLRSQYMIDISIFPPEMLVFIDESGFDRRDAMRRYGYSLRGHPCSAISHLTRGQHLSVIAAMCTDGVIGCQIFEGGVNAARFRTFLEMDVSSKLLPFNGVNPRSVIVMDNAAIHHADQDEVARELEQLGVLVYFLPPYSPDLNPIELLFSKVKYVMKDNENLLSGYDLETSILYSFISVTSVDSVNWINHSGY